MLSFVERNVERQKLCALTNQNLKLRLKNAKYYYNVIIIIILCTGTTARSRVA